MVLKQIVRELVLAPTMHLLACYYYHNRVSRYIPARTNPLRPQFATTFQLFLLAGTNLFLDSFIEWNQAQDRTRQQTFRSLLLRKLQPPQRSHDPARAVIGTFKETLVKCCHSLRCLPTRKRTSCSPRPFLNAAFIQAHHPNTKALHRVPTYRSSQKALAFQVSHVS